MKDKIDIDETVKKETEEKPKIKKVDWPDFIEVLPDSDSVKSKIWKKLKPIGLTTPVLIVKRLGPQLYGTLKGIYVDCGGDESNPMNLVESVQKAFTEWAGK